VEFLKGSGYGELIDSFDCVVRFNRAPTDGFETNVGTRTDVHVVNGHVFVNTKIDGSGWGKEHEVTQPQYFVRDLRNMKILCVGQGLPKHSEIYQHTDPSNKVYYFDYNKMNYLKNEFGFKKNLGVGTCFIVLSIISGFDVHMFGIDIENRCRDHYWEDRPEAGPCHDVPNEKLILEKNN